MIIAMYDTLGHALAKHRPATCVDDPRPGQLVRLFDVVVTERPEPSRVRVSVDVVDRLRTTHLRRGVMRWPVRLPALPAIALDCLRVIQRVESSVGSPVGRLLDVATPS